MAEVVVEVEWPVADLPAGAVAYVRVEDVSRADAGATTAAEEVITDVPRAPDRVALDVDEVRPGADYSVRVHVSRNGSREVDVGDYVSVESYPVLTRGAGEAARVRLQRVG